MKVAFDEHIPPGMVGPVRDLLDVKGSVEIVLAKDYADPPAKSDVPWLVKYAADGGQIVITGDRDMRSRVDERKALQELPLIVFFFPPAWNTWNMTSKCAFLLQWWPSILEKAKQSKPGDRWELKLSWTALGEFRDVTSKQKGA